MNEERFKREVEEVKRLGDQIGYGNMMTIASALWAKMLTDTLTVNLDRQSKKAWGRIFQMQKYKVTEWMFPKKKKRGTARRIRQKGKQHG